MNKHEEDLQKNIEAGEKPTGDDMDILAYREVFSRLQKEPDFYLPADFADVMVTRIIEKKKLDTSKDLLWLGAGVFLLLIAFATTAVMSGFKPDLGFLKNMSSYLGLFVFGVLFILILNFLEKRIVPRKNPFSETNNVG